MSEGGKKEIQEKKEDESKPSEINEKKKDEDAKKDDEKEKSEDSTNENSDDSNEEKENKEEEKENKEENKENKEENKENKEEEKENKEEEKENKEEDKENKENKEEEKENKEEDKENKEENKENKEKDKENKEEDKENKEEDKENKEENKENKEEEKTKKAENNQEKDENEKKNNSNAQKRIVIQTPIMENKEEQKNSTQQQRHKSKHPTRKPRFKRYIVTDEDTSVNAEELGQKILKGEQDPLKINPSHALPLINYLSDYREEKLEKNEVDEYEKSDFILTQIIDNYKQEIKMATQKRHHEEAIKKLQKVENDLTKLEKDSENQMRELQQQDRQMLQELKERQMKEVDDLIQKFNTPAVQRHYVQASANLRNIRAQTELLRKTKRFNELRVAERSCARQAKLEAKEAHRNMSIELSNQLALLQRKHNTEYEHHLIAIEDKESRLKILNDKKIAAVKRHRDNILIDINQLKQPNNVWNLHHRGEIITVSRNQASSRSARTRSSDPTLLSGLSLPPLVITQKPKTRLSSSDYKI